MHIVEQTSRPPGRCFLTGDINGPYLDTDFDYHFEAIGQSGHCYIHVPVVRQMAREVGMIEPERYEEALNVIAAQDQAIADLQEANEGFRAELAAIQVLEKRDYKSKKKPGRKPAAERKVPSG